MLESILDKRRLVRKGEVTAATKGAMGELSRRFKHLSEALAAEIAAPFIDRTVLARRVIASGEATDVPIRVTGATLGITGFRLVGEWIDPITSLTHVAAITIEEIV